MENLLTTPSTCISERSQALGAVIRQHQAQIWRYLRLLGASAVDADDLMQETFLRVLRQQGNTVDANTPLAAWLRTVARNLFLDSRRWNKVRAADIAWSDAVDAFLVVEPAALVDDRVQAMQNCLAQLDGRVRRALELRHRDGVDQESIATELGLRVNGLKAMLRRARALLRDCVTRQQNQDRGRS